MTINELNSLTARNRLVLVDFYASWCGPCNAMQPILDAVEKQFGNSVDILRVDVDQYESVGLVQHFRIMSVPTLMRLFKTAIGTSPANFITMQRISRAKILLTNTNMSITTIANETGFFDNAHFTRTFKKLTGMSPTQYRHKEFT